MKQLKGIIPIVITPFDEDGRLDLDSQRSLVKYLIAAGAHGLGILANASEGYTLSGSERLELMRTILREVNGRVPVVVSTGHTGTDVAVALSREAEQEGADALMILPPYYLRPDVEGTFQYYKAISDAVAIPIMVQDAPLLTQVNMGAGLLARMARELEHVRYAKIEAPPTAPKITEVVGLAGASLTVFGGLNGNFFIEELNRGAEGTMPGSDLIPEFVRMWDLFRRGSAADARRLFTRCLSLIRYELQPGLGVSAMKHNLMTAGVIRSARIRHPTKTLDSVGLQELKLLMQDLSSAESLPCP